MIARFKQRKGDYKLTLKTQNIMRNLNIFRSVLKVFKVYFLIYFSYLPFPSHSWHIENKIIKKYSNPPFPCFIISAKIMLTIKNNYTHMFLSFLISFKRNFNLPSLFAKSLAIRRPLLLAMILLTLSLNS